MHLTKNDLPQKSRESLVKLLNERLIDLIDLQIQTKHAHWNVKGPNFIALHELFDDVAEAVEEFTDEVAERVSTLGGTTESLVADVAKRTTLPAYPGKAISGADHVKALSTALAAAAKGARAAINKSEELGDKVTADLFTEVTAGLDKKTWFVESHLQAER